MGVSGPQTSTDARLPRRRSCAPPPGRTKPMAETGVGRATGRARSTAEMARVVGVVSRLRELGILAALAVLIVGVGLAVPQFRSVANFGQILLSVSILAI